MFRLQGYVNALRNIKETVGLDNLPNFLQVLGLWGFCGGVCGILLLSFYGAQLALKISIGLGCVLFGVVFYVGIRIYKGDNNEIS